MGARALHYVILAGIGAVMLALATGSAAGPIPNVRAPPGARVIASDALARPPVAVRVPQKRAAGRVWGSRADYALLIHPLIQQGSKLTGSGEIDAGEFGYSVALSADGNTALIGGPFDFANDDGAAWVFTRSGATWVQQGSKLTGSGGALGYHIFGYSVALSADGNTALIGGVGYNGGCGAAWCSPARASPGHSRGR
jgi:hypothetical protein